MAEPLISIGITAYREGPWLQECWDSVLAQSDPRWEAILVLDGGADRCTRRIVEQIEHPRLRKIICRENLGPYPARTLAIEAARTGWYAHLDADDRLPPRAVELILAAAAASPEADFVFGDCLYFGFGPEQVNPIRTFDSEGLVLCPVVNGQSPIRIDLFRQLGGFAPQLLRGGADWDFWIGVSELGATGARAGGAIYERRRHPNSVGMGWRLRRADVAQTLIERHPAYFASEKRQRQCLALAYEQMARDYRALGRRREAAMCAQQAMQYGSTAEMLQPVVEEAQMRWWRYGLRRLGRSLSRAVR